MEGSAEVVVKKHKKGKDTGPKPIAIVKDLNKHLKHGVAQPFDKEEANAADSS